MSWARCRKAKGRPAPPGRLLPVSPGPWRRPRPVHSKGCLVMTCGCRLYQQPAPPQADGRHQRQAYQDGEQVQHREVAEGDGQAAAGRWRRRAAVAPAAPMDRPSRPIKRRARGAGDRSADPATGAGRGEGAQVASGLAVTRLVGHDQHAERDDQAEHGGAVAADLIEPQLTGLGPDGHPSVGRDLPGRADLGRGELLRRLDEPAVQRGLQLVPGLDRVRGDDLCWAPTYRTAARRAAGSSGCPRRSGVACGLPRSP